MQKKPDKSFVLSKTKQKTNKQINKQQQQQTKKSHFHMICC